MTKFFASTAIVALLVGPAFAQTATETAPAAAPMTTEAPAADATTPTAATTDAAAPMATDTVGFGYMAMAGDMSAETFLEKNLYVSEADVDVNAAMTEVDADWDDIGEISDIVLGSDGQIKAVLVDIGGFLGMGEKTVAVAMDQLRMVKDGDSEGDYFVVFTSDRAALENAAEFEWAEM